MQRKDGGRRISEASNQLAGYASRQVRAGYHALYSHEVLAEFGTSPDGLTAQEARQRLQTHGMNQLPEVSPRNPVFRFFSHFNNVLIYFLLSAAIVALVLGHLVDGAVIIAVVIVNAVVGFVQEGKADNALRAIRNMIAPETTVMRDGKRQTIAVAELVPGDIVLLEAGDRVPADMRLMRVRALRIEEAVLTGESAAAEKQDEPVAENAALGDRACMAFSGTIVVAGQATGVIVATGANTEIGRISTLLGGVQELTTPLLEQINRFGRGFTWITLGAGVLLFLFAVQVRDMLWSDALLAVLAIAVSAIPEGLPAVITITLAIGVRRMAARSAVVRQLPAVETLGATSVICSDKTGTFTRNEMTARRVVTADGQSLATGAGYSPQGDVLPTNGISTATTTLIRTGLLCNDSRIYQDAGSWLVHGDPMEGALVALAMKAGFKPEQERRQWKRLDEIPFDAQHRYMAVLCHEPGGEQLVMVKGAPERLLEMCSLQRAEQGVEPLDSNYWIREIDAAATEGERVLGFAVKFVGQSNAELKAAMVEQGMTFLGLVGFIDPPREEAVRAVADCQSAGIAVKMITGDHATTASAIARQLGLAESPTVLTGRQLDEMPDRELDAAIRTTEVFARTSPEHKLRIVRSLQKDGAVVAMTGDGVNDAPSLKQANVGIAMGKKGTEAAKQAAKIVLLDDNFATIVAAVHEGRTIFDNIRKVVAWTLPTNGGEVLAVLMAIVFGFTMPMSPAQILWINLITTVTLGLVLAFEPSEPGVMSRPPRPAKTSLLSAFYIWRTFLVSVLFAVATLAIFFYALETDLGLDMARTLVVNLIVVMEIFYLFNVRYLHTTSFTWRGALGTRPVLAALAVVIIAQLAFTYLPFMQLVFETQPVSIANGVIIISAGFLLMLILEAEKRAMRRFGLLAS